MYEGGQAAYRETEVLSSSPERLIPLMYEKLLVSLKRGAMCIGSSDIEGKHEHLTRAQDLVFELLSSLNYEEGGEIAVHLGSLYAFWAREISEASRSLQAERLNRVVAMVADLHESWVEAVRVMENAGTLADAMGPPT